MKLSRSQKVRMISLLIIIILLFLYYVSYILGIQQTIEIEPSEKYYVDGTDFTPLVDLAKTAANAMLLILGTGLSLVIMAVICILSLLAWRFITIQEDSVIAQSELFITKVMLITFALSILIAGLTVIGSSFLPAILAHMLVSSVLCIVFAYLPLKKAYTRQLKESP